MEEVEIAPISFPDRVNFCSFVARFFALKCPFSPFFFRELSHRLNNSLHCICNHCLRFGPPELELEAKARFGGLVAEEQEVGRLVEFLEVLEVLEEHEMQGVREEVVARVEGAEVEARDVPGLLEKSRGKGRAAQVGLQLCLEWGQFGLHSTCITVSFEGAFSNV